MKEYEIPKNSIDKSKEEIKRKQLEAQNNAASISAFLVNNFDALNQYPKEKEKQVLDYLFNEFVANSDKQSKVFEEKEIQNIKKKRLEKFGLDDLSDNLITEPLSDIRKVRSMYRLNNLDGVLADTNGAETLKSLIISNIKNSDEYKALMAAKNKNEMGTVINNAKSSLLSKMNNGEMAFSGINIPDSAVNIYKAMMPEYDGSMDHCHRSLDAAISKSLGEMPQYRKYKLDSLSPEALKKNAENMHDLNKFFGDYDSFSWFSSGDTKFSDLKDSLNEISKMAKALGNPANPISSKAFTKYIKTVKEVIKKANEYNSDKKNTDTEKKYAVSELIKALSVSISNSKKLNNDQMLKDAEALGVRDLIEGDDNLESYYDELRAKSVFRGEKYKNVTIDNGNGSYTLSRWGSYSITVMALAATGKYTFDELADTDKILKEKEEMFDEVINRASNVTPENQKWIAEKIYKGQKVIRDLIDEADKGVDYNDPHFEKTDLYRKLSFIQFMYFDSWQEMKHCSDELTALAKEENPAFADYVTFKDHISSTHGLATVFRQSASDFVSILRDYIDGTRPDVVNTLVARGANYYLGKQLVINYYKEHPDVKYSERGGESISSACLLIATALSQNDAGLKQITKVVNQEPEIQKAFLAPLLNGTIFSDINVSYDKETNMPIFEGLKELGDLFETRNVEYIKEKLADKSYLKRNSIESRMAATRKDRTDLLIDKNTGKARSFNNLSPEEITKAAKLFDDTFGPFLNKKGVSDYLNEGTNRNIADLFYVGNQTLRQKIGPVAEYMLNDSNALDSVKALIAIYATDPSVELKVKDIERNIKTNKYESEIKGIIDIEDMDRIITQVPYLDSLESFKTNYNKLNQGVNTKEFSESYWNELYKHEFNIIAEHGLVPEERIISEQKIKQNVNKAQPYDEVFEDLKTLYGPKQMFIKEWAGSHNGNRTIYDQRVFLDNMIDVNPGGFNDNDFTTLAYFCALDPDVLNIQLNSELDESIINHDMVFASCSNKWTSDIHANGNGLPRAGMYTAQADKIKLARTSAADMIQTLSAGDARPLAKAIVRGLRETMGSLKICNDFSKSMNDAFLYIYMIAKLDEAVKSNEALSGAVNDLLSPEEMKELNAVIKFQNVIEKYNIAEDRLTQAENGEVELKNREREGYVKDIFTFEHLSKLWAENYDDFTVSEEYLREASKLPEMRKLEKNISWQTLVDSTFTTFQKTFITVSSEFMDDVMNEEHLKYLSEELTEKINKVKEDFDEQNEEYKNLDDRFRELDESNLDGDQLEELYKVERDRYNSEYCMTQFGEIVADKVTSKQLETIISRYNVLAKEKGWTQLNTKSNAKTTFSSMASPKEAGEKLEAFYNIVFNELEKTPSVFDAIFNETQNIKSIGNLQPEELIEKPVEKQIDKIKKKNLSKATKDMLDEVNNNLAVKNEKYIPIIQRYESVNAVMENITKQAKAKVVGQNDRELVFSDDVKKLAISTIKKMNEYGLITGEAKTEQDSKVYAYHKLLDAKENLKKAVATGNIEKIDEANNLYEAEHDKMRDIFKTVKNGIGGKEIVAGNLDTIRTKEVPVEFSYDYQTDSVVNGFYVIAETCKRMNVSVEDYLNNPVKVTAEYINNKTRENNIESKVRSSKTFAESFNALYKAGEEEILNPSFLKNVTGGSIGTTIGRPLDVLCLLDSDSQKLIDLQSKKFDLTERISNKLDNEQNLTESVYRLSNMSDSFMRSEEYSSFMEGLKDAFLSNDKIRRVYIGAIYKNGKAEKAKDENAYSYTLQTPNLYDRLIKAYNDNKEAAKNGHNIVKRILVESMYDYLMAHPEDINKPEYKALLKLAGTASKELGVKYPDSTDERLMSPDKKFNKWQKRVEEETKNLAGELELEEAEFDKQYQALVLSGADEEVITNVLAVRLSELIEGYKLYKVSESYLKARAEQLVELRNNPGIALPQHPKFLDYDSDDARYEFEMINERIQGTAFPEHLSSVEAYKKWRLGHDVIINEEGLEQVVESDGLGITEDDLTPEEWKMSWENAIRSSNLGRNIPVSVIGVEEFLANTSGSEDEMEQEAKPEVEVKPEEEIKPEEEVKSEVKPEEEVKPEVEVKLENNINNFEDGKDEEIKDVVIEARIQKAIEEYEREQEEIRLAKERDNYDNEEKMILSAKAVNNVVFEMITSVMDCQKELSDVKVPKDFETIMKAMKEVSDATVGANGRKNTLAAFSRKYRNLLTLSNNYLKAHKNKKGIKTELDEKLYEMVSQIKSKGDVLIETFNTFSSELVRDIKNSRIINKELADFTMAEILDNYMGSKELKKFFDDREYSNIGSLLDDIKVNVADTKTSVILQGIHENIINNTKNNSEMDATRYIISDDYTALVKPNLIGKSKSLHTSAQAYIAKKYLDGASYNDNLEELQEILRKTEAKNFNKEVSELENNVAFKIAHECDPIEASGHYNWIKGKTDYAIEKMGDALDVIRAGEKKPPLDKYNLINNKLMSETALAFLYSKPENRQYMDSLYIMGEFGCEGGAVQAANGIKRDLFYYFNKNVDAQKLKGKTFDNLNEMVDFVTSKKIQNDIKKIVEKNVSHALSTKLGRMKKYQENRYKRIKVDRVKEELKSKEKVKKNFKARIKYNKEFIKETEKEGYSFNREGLEKQIKEDEAYLKELDEEIRAIKENAKIDTRKKQEEERQKEKEYQEELKENELKRKVNSTKKKLLKAQQKVKDLQDKAQDAKEANKLNVSEAYLEDAKEAEGEVKEFEEKLQKAKEEYEKFIAKKNALEESNEKEEDQKEMQSENKKEGPKKAQPKKEEPKNVEPKKTEAKKVGPGL